MSRLVLCGVVSWLVVASSAARGDEAEDKAVKLVEKLGGKITRDEKQPGKPVVAVSMYGTKVRDAHLKELAALKSLTKLDLGGTEVRDPGLKELAALKNLTELDLNNTKVTQEGVKGLQKALPKCKIEW